MKRLLLLFILITNATYSQVTPTMPAPAHPSFHRPQHDPPVVVNFYTEVLLLDKCQNAITVSNDSSFKVGDTVLLIQMKGAIIDTSNTASFGTILDYKNAGNYEFNFISQKLGNVLTFKNKLTRSYDIPDGIVQLVRIPYFKNSLLLSGLTCMPWDGSKGGVLAITSRNGLTSFGEFDVSGRGFRGGEGFNAVLPPSNCSANSFNYPASSQMAGCKGESIGVIPQNISKGKGAPSGGGGGGNSHNSGGGGGGNAGAGGMGGYQSDSCGNAPFDNRGLGGKQLSYTSTANKIFMGGGGGAGHLDNITPGVPPQSGGAGGGIIIVISDSIDLTGYPIASFGDAGKYCYSQNCSDGMGGGGAGGTILLSVAKVIDTLAIQALGGGGGNVYSSILPGGRVGPGGGGGGGAIFLNGSGLAGNITIATTAGNNGVIILNSSNPWGATNGTDGVNYFNLSLPFDTVLFKPNIDSLQIRDSLINCNSFNFKGIAFTNTNPIASWYWDFNDGNSAFTQNAVHSYASTNFFSVKLIVTDVNGCKDSTSKTVNPKNLGVDAGINRSLCSDVPVSVFLQGSGTGIYAWSPALYLNDSTQQDPVATVDTTTTFYLNLTGNGCTVTDSVTISINRFPPLNISKSNDVNCTLPYARLKVTGAAQYLWNPSSSLSTTLSDNPVANPSQATTYFVTGTSSNGCSIQDSITVTADFSTGSLMFPNTFTPNGDGINDCFGMSHSREVEKLVFMIFNRYGVKVFKSTNAAQCWDGNYKGQKADTGNYVYYITAKTLCGDLVKKGSILLIR